MNGYGMIFLFVSSIGVAAVWTWAEHQSLKKIEACKRQHPAYKNEDLLAALRQDRKR